MAANNFEECLNLALNNCPITRGKNFVLKEKQIETLSVLFEGRDCVSILPTGYGKSVIFQLLPWFAQYKEGRIKPMVVIVVSPLSSLMHDQVINMRKKRVHACIVNTAGTHGISYDDPDDEDNENASVEYDVPFEQLQRGDFSLIYAHPETFLNTRFSTLLRSKLYKDTVCAVVIDEVHMVSEWGEEFRPAFQRLGELMCIFDDALHLLLTATATPKSVTILSKQLNLKNAMVVSENVDRSNIYIEIRRRLPNVKKFEKYDEVIGPIVAELKEKRETFPVTIMYVESLEALGYFYQYTSYELKEEGYIGDPIAQNRIYGQYHKDYPESMKKLIINELTKENPILRLVLATVALGMGVNAPSVVSVIHCQPPTTLEKYMQEIGRAGRLGQPAIATMFFNNSDLAKNRKGLTDDMRQFCKTTTCLRQMLVTYFGFDHVIYDGEMENCCSNCRNDTMSTV